MPIKYLGKDAIAICRRIRRYADHRKIDYTDYDCSPQLLNYIKTSRMTFKEFAKNYLRNIQPFGMIHVTDGGSDEVLIDTTMKDGMLIEVTDTGFEPMRVSFSHNNILADGKKPAVKYRGNQLCAVFTDTAEMNKNFEYEVKYTVPYGLATVEVTGRTKYYGNGIALVRYAEIEKACKQIIQNIYKDIRNYSCFTDETYRMARIRRGRGHERILVPVKLVDRIRAAEFSSVSIGFMPENYIHFLIELYSIIKDEKMLCYIMGLADEILMEMPNFRIEEMRRALVYRRNPENELRSLIIQKKLPSVEVDENYKIDTVYAAEDIQFATEEEVEMLLKYGYVPEKKEETV